MNDWVAWHRAYDEPASAIRARPPDLTPRIRAWFGGNGIDEVAFDALDTHVLTVVGVHRLRDRPMRPTALPGDALFTFAPTRSDEGPDPTVAVVTPGRPRSRHAGGMAFLTVGNVAFLASYLAVSRSAAARSAAERSWADGRGCTSRATRPQYLVVTSL